MLNAKPCFYLSNNKNLISVSYKKHTQLYMILNSGKISGNDLWLLHGSERSAGVTSLKNKFERAILHCETDSNGRFVVLIIKVDDIIVLLANLYGYNTKTDNDLLFTLWDHILHPGYLNIQTCCSLPVVISMLLWMTLWIDGPQEIEQTLPPMSSYLCRNFN